MQTLDEKAIIGNVPVADHRAAVQFARDVERAKRAGDPEGTVRIPGGQPDRMRGAEALRVAGFLEEVRPGVYRQVERGFIL